MKKQKTIDLHLHADLITYLRETSPSIAMVPRLEPGPPGQVLEIITATASLGWSENISITQKASSGSRIY